jgi:hypothetical protein
MVPSVAKAMERLRPTPAALVLAGERAPAKQGHIYLRISASSSVQEVASFSGNSSILRESEGLIGVKNYHPAQIPPRPMRNTCV